MDPDRSPRPAPEPDRMSTGVADYSTDAGREPSGHPGSVGQTAGLNAVAQCAAFPFRDRGGGQALSVAGPGPIKAAVPAVLVEEPGWRRLMRRPAEVARRAASAAGGAGAILLTGDRQVRRLNWRHRGKNKPTNVLTFEPASRLDGGDLVLAFETVRREAAAAGLPMSHHLAHLVVHGCLHLRGFDHVSAGEARRMELAEARILRRIGVPNPWKRR